MKATAIFMIALIISTAISSCNESDMPAVTFSQKEQFNNLSSKTRSFDEAFAVAEKALYFLDRNNSRTQNRTIVSNKAFAILNKTHSSRNNSSDTLLYVINYDNNEGFAVVSASKHTPALLAVTESGHIYENEDIDNPGLKIFMEMAQYYVNNSGKNDTDSIFDRDPKEIGGGSDISTPKEFKYVTDTIEYNEVKPRVTINWGQRVPEGLFISNRFAGCGTVCILMAMDYLKSPSLLRLSYLDNSIVTIDWDNIKSMPRNKYNGTLIYDMATSELISHVCAEIVQQSGTKDFRKDGTFMTAQQFYTALRNLLKKYGTFKDKPSAVKGQLEGIDIVSGFPTSNLYNDGHFWVIDGCKYLHVKISYFERRIDRIKWNLISEHEEKTDYIHINWGWYGQSNGYYLPYVYDTSQLKLADNQAQIADTLSYKYNIQYLNINK